MFEAPTVAELANRIEAARQIGAGSEAPPIRRAATRDQIPLSFAQQRLWFLDQLQPGNALYNMPQMFVMRGELDLGQLVLLAQLTDLASHQLDLADLLYGSHGGALGASGYVTLA